MNHPEAALFERPELAGTRWQAEAIEEQLAGLELPADSQGQVSSIKESPGNGVWISAADPLLTVEAPISPLRSRHPRRDAVALR